MIIVANMFVLKIISKIDIFKIDLGQNITGPYSEDRDIKMDIRDTFVKNYNASTGRLVHKFGYIGSLEFYNDPLLSRDELLVFHDKKIHNPDINITELTKETRIYLSKMLEGITKDVEDVKTEDIIEELPSNEKIDVKNGKDMNKEEFLQEIIKQRKKLNNNG